MRVINSFEIEVFSEIRSLKNFLFDLKSTLSLESLLKYRAGRCVEQRFCLSEEQVCS
jgi:hypothetical protein